MFQPKNPLTPQELARPEARFITIPFAGSDGIETHYRYHSGKEGADREITYVLLHGFADNLESWHQVFDYFAEKGAVLAYDRPGSGLSGRPIPGGWNDLNPYGFEGMLQQFETLVDQLKIGKMILVGNSYGGLMATELGRRFPDQVVGLILAAGAILNPRPPPFLQKLAGLRSIQWVMRFVFWLIQFLNPVVLFGLYYNRSGLAERSKRRWDNDYRLENHVLAGGAMTLANVDFPTIEADLDQIKQPVLLVHGSHDRALPAADSRKLHQMWPQSTLHIFERCGHVPMDEQPERFKKVVEEWLEGRE